MNRTMPPRDRSNRSDNSRPPSRPSRALPGAVGLVDRAKTDSTWNELPLTSGEWSWLRLVVPGVTGILVNLATVPDS